MLKVKLRKPRRLKGSSAFTIVELLIVLAIAGLILAIVFLAVPQTQRSARNTQRKSTTLKIKTELETYAANNEGLYPFAGVGANPVSCNTQTAASSNCGEWFDNYICTDTSYTGTCTAANTKVKIQDSSSATDVTIYYDNTVATPTNSWKAGDIFLLAGAQCNGASPSGTSGLTSTQKYALMTMLEKSGTWYCVDNN